jgi:hypothetical protein
MPAKSPFCYFGIVLGWVPVDAFIEPFQAESTFGCRPNSFLEGNIGGLDLVKDSFVCQPLAG